jgi:hypothetical protein
VVVTARDEAAVAVGGDVVDAFLVVVIMIFVIYIINLYSC